MVDWQRIAELEEDIGADDINAVLAMFVGEMDEIMAGLADVPAGPELEAQLHLLKGMALNTGFGDLGALCADAERAQSAGADALDFNAIQQTFTLAREELLSGRNIAALIE